MYGCPKHFGMCEELFTERPWKAYGRAGAHVYVGRARGRGAGACCRILFSWNDKDPQSIERDQKFPEGSQLTRAHPSPAAALWAATDHPSLWKLHVAFQNRQVVALWHSGRSCGWSSPWKWWKSMAVAIDGNKYWRRFSVEPFIKKRLQVEPAQTGS